MEFKSKLKKRQKAQKVENKRLAGKVRVKVRGRKRWIDTTDKKSAGSAE